MRSLVATLLVAVAAAVMLVAAAALHGATAVAAKSPSSGAAKHRPSLVSSGKKQHVSASKLAAFAKLQRKASLRAARETRKLEADEARSDQDVAAREADAARAEAEQAAKAQKKALKVAEAEKHALLRAQETAIKQREQDEHKAALAQKAAEAAAHHRERAAAKQEAHAAKQHAADLKHAGKTLLKAREKAANVDRALVSVIVPHYEPETGKPLVSRILNETWPRIEVLLIDDRFAGARSVSVQKTTIAPGRTVVHVGTAPLDYASQHLALGLALAGGDYACFWTPLQRFGFDRIKAQMHAIARAVNATGAEQALAAHGAPRAAVVAPSAVIVNGNTLVRPWKLGERPPLLVTHGVDAHGNDEWVLPYTLLFPTALAPTLDADGGAAAFTASRIVEHLGARVVAMHGRRMASALYQASHEPIIDASTALPAASRAPWMAQALAMFDGVDSGKLRAVQALLQHEADADWRLSPLPRKKAEAVVAHAHKAVRAAEHEHDDGREVHIDYAKLGFSANFFLRNKPRGDD